MVFAVFYILFFVLDILISTRFYIFGMMAVDYWVAGIGLFFLVFLCRRLPLYPDKSPANRIVELMLALILLITAFRLSPGILRLFRLDVLYLENHWTHTGQITVFWLGAALFIRLLFRFRLRERLTLWIAFILAGILIRYGILLYVVNRPTPLFYRYMGVLDLPYLFGLLVVIDLIMRRELEFHASD